MQYASRNPTKDLYGQLQKVADYFNNALFEGELPPHVFTLQRNKGVAGYFSAKRWAHATGEMAHEIALNPTFFASRSLLQLFQTIVHEQCHVWQFEFGSPGRPGYHNAEWAGKMIEIGLIPSSTGMPDGARIGQKMADYPEQSGKFVRACKGLIETGFDLTWVDQGFTVPVDQRAEIDTREFEERINQKLNSPIGSTFVDLHSQFQPVSVAQKRKTKYQCPTCSLNVWGKPGLNICCGECGVVLVVAAKEERAKSEQ